LALSGDAPCGGDRASGKDLGHRNAIFGAAEVVGRRLQLGKRRAKGSGDLFGGWQLAMQHVLGFVQASRLGMRAADGYAQRGRQAFVDLDGLQRAMESLLQRNGLMHGAAKIYCQITRGAAPRDHAFPCPAVPPTVYVTAVSYTLPVELWETGVRAILTPDIRWARCDIKSLNLLGNVLATQKAKEAGAYEAILTRDGFVTEGSHTGVCAVLDGAVAIHPLTPEILGSVTRDVVLRLCKELQIPHTERDVSVEDLLDAEEVMVLGTTSGVMSVIDIDGHQIGAGCPGPIARRLQAVLHARMCGGTLPA
jgi:D-alanine transaminase